MKYKKIIIASVVTVIIIAILYTAFYYRTIEEEHQLTQKRNAIFEPVFLRSWANMIGGLTNNHEKQRDISSRINLGQV
jgi:hypothetical protein